MSAIVQADVALQQSGGIFFQGSDRLSTRSGAPLAKTQPKLVGSPPTRDPAKRGFHLF
jgi:hypothetical protein